MPTLEIEPNDKYHNVIAPQTTAEVVGDDWEDTPQEHRDAADAYLKTIDEAAQVAEDHAPPEDERATLSWDLFSVSKDPDLVAKMATYFTGMDPDDPTDELRAKLRMLDVGTYTNAQIAARSELHD